MKRAACEGRIDVGKMVGGDADAAAAADDDDADDDYANVHAEGENERA